jgi:hypothetical protein
MGLLRRLLEAPPGSSLASAASRAVSRLWGEGGGPIVGLFRYGLMTAGQLIPGFATFCASR